MPTQRYWYLFFTSSEQKNIFKFEPIETTTLHFKKGSETNNFLKNLKKLYYEIL